MLPCFPCSRGELCCLQVFLEKWDCAVASCGMCYTHCCSPSLEGWHLLIYLLSLIHLLPLLDFFNLWFVNLFACVMSCLHFIWRVMMFKHEIIGKWHHTWFLYVRTHIHTILLLTIDNIDYLWHFLVQFWHWNCPILVNCRHWICPIK